MTDPEPVIVKLTLDTSKFAAGMKRAGDFAALLAWQLDTWTTRLRDAELLSPPVLDAWTEQP